MTRVAIWTFALVCASDAWANVREIRLTVRQQSVEIAGSKTPAMTINGQIPGPTLRWNLGDRARVRVDNQMDVATSIHWHGILLPNREDGVPGLTTPPIPPGESHVFEFPIRVRMKVA